MDFLESDYKFALRPLVPGINEETAEFIHNPMKRYASAWQENVNNVVLRRLMTCLSTATAAEDGLLKSPGQKCLSVYSAATRLPTMKCSTVTGAALNTPL